MKGATLSQKSSGELLASIDAALRALRAPPPLSDDNLHDARKAIKKARAALRLLREGIGESFYATENAALRDAGRSLAPIRDAKSLGDAFEAFRNHHARAARSLGGIATALNIKRLATRRNLFADKGQLRDCVRALTRSRERIGRLGASALASSQVAEGIERIHRAGRKSLRNARKAETPEALHEWRKQVKYLMNALETLDAKSDPRLAKIGKRARKLADCLGDDHDLAELGRYMAARTSRGVPAAKLAKRFEGDRKKLQRKAWRLGERIFDEKSARLAASLVSGEGVKA